MTTQHPDTAAFADDGVRQGRRKELGWFLVAMIPLSALLAFVVLQLMAASSAAATGGCGGG